MSNKKKVVVAVVGATSAAVAGLLGYMAYLNKKDFDELFTMHDDEDEVEDDDFDTEYSDDEYEDDDEEDSYLSFDTEDEEDEDEGEYLCDSPLSFFTHSPFGRFPSHEPITPLVAPASSKSEELKRDYLNKRAEYRASRKEDQDKYVESLRYMTEHSLSDEEKSSLEFVKKHLASNPSYAQAMEYMRVHGDITNSSEKR